MKGPSRNCNIENSRNEATAAYAPLRIFGRQPSRRRRRTANVQSSRATYTRCFSWPSLSTSCVIATYASTANPPPSAVNVIGL